ncbi:MAG: oligopeptide/dipeptide ABC transporter ATP-binding protein [Comamonadaceae bacterium]
MLKGELPSPLNPPLGCVFSTRCPYATRQCQSDRPVLQELHGRLVACFEAQRIAAADSTQ